MEAGIAERNATFVDVSTSCVIFYSDGEVKILILGVEILFLEVRGNSAVLTWKRKRQLPQEAPKN